MRKLSRWLTVRILRARWNVLKNHERDLLRCLREYPGAPNDLRREWGDALVRVRIRKDEVTAKLGGLK